MTMSIDCVKPRNLIKLEPIALSILDALAPSYYNAFLYYFERPEGGAARASWDEAMSTASLRAALAALLDTYPVLGGMLRLVEGTGERELYVDSELDPEYGIPLYEGETTLDFASLRARQFQVSEAESSSLCPDNLWAQLAQPRPPLFVVKLNRFACGSLCIGIGFHHVSSDGNGHFNAVNAWGEIARGLSPRKCEIQRTRFLRPSEGVKRLPPPIRESAGPLVFELPITSSRALSIKAEKLNLLKQEAAETSGERVSSHNVATALVWRAMARARHDPAASTLRPDIAECGFAVNMRMRQNLEFVPSLFFGNASIFCALKFRYADFADAMSISQVARALREVIQGVDGAFLQHCIDYSHRHFHQHPHIVGMLEPFNLWELNSVTSILGLPIYELDFGAGRPMFIGIPHWPGATGLATFMPSGDGNFDDLLVYFMMREDAIRRLLADEELLRYAELL